MSWFPTKSERGSDGKHRAANAGACKRGLQGCGGKHSFLKSQQWLATNYVLLLYAAIFVISARYFSRTDVARNWLGVITIAAFVVHWWMLHLFQRSIEN